jgi:hypothetical protein
VDATVSQRAICARTNGIGADGEVVWSWRPDAGAKLAMMLRITPMTVAKEPGHRGEHEVSRKPLRRECRMIWLNLW